MQSRLVSMRAAAVAVTTMTIAWASMAYVEAGREARSQLPVPGPPPTTFAADVAIRQAVIRPDGQPLRTPPALALRVARWRTSSGWKTTARLTGLDRPVVNSGTTPVVLDNPFIPGRMEFDGNGTAPRFFAQDGTPLADPARADRGIFGIGLAAGSTSGTTPGVAVPIAPVPPKDAWIDDIVLTPEARAARLAAIALRLGPPVARLSGSDRYAITLGQTTYEVLAGSDSGAIFEINVIRNGTELVRHTTYTYESRPNGVLVRQLTRSEQLMAGPSADRVINEMTLTNVTWGWGSAL